MTLAVGAVAMLGVMVNWLAAGLLAFTVFFYVAVYTMWLKRWTAQNIVIGGAAGAAPPLLGWVAVTGQVDAGALALFLIILVWTPPHFWALAIHRRDDYARAGIPMLPVARGVAHTTARILQYSVALVAVSLLPVVVGMSGPVYGLGAAALGARFVLWAWRLRRDSTLAMPVFRYSIVYLFALFALLLVDHGLAGAAWDG